MGEPKHRRLSLAAAALGAALSVAAAPLDAAQSQSLGQMDHATWTARDGAPQGVLALAQAHDGTLWIGAEAGLYNFDGVTFTPFKSLPGDPPVPVEPVSSVLVARDGSVWAAFLQGGAARIAKGRLTLFSKLDDQPVGYLRSLQESQDATIWALAEDRYIVRMGADGLWHKEPSPARDGRMGRFLIDSSNTLWVAQDARLYRRLLSQKAYLATDVEVDLSFGMTEARDGGIWVTDAMLVPDRGRTQHVDRQGHLIATLPDATLPLDIAYVPDGSIVLATQGGGVHRFPPEDVAALGDAAGVSPDTIGTNAGLTSNEVFAVLVDTDENIWLGSNRGLDRLRKTQIVRFVRRACRHPDDEGKP